MFFQITAPKTRELTLTKLLPYALYNITIVVIPIYENRTETGFWSDNVTTSIRTAEDGKTVIRIDQQFFRVAFHKIVFKGARWSK